MKFLTTLALVLFANNAFAGGAAYWTCTSGEAGVSAELEGNMLSPGVLLLTVDGVTSTYTEDQSAQFSDGRVLYRTEGDVPALAKPFELQGEDAKKFDIAFTILGHALKCERL